MFSFKMPSLFTLFMLTLWRINACQASEEHKDDCPFYFTKPTIPISLEERPTFITPSSQTEPLERKRHHSEIIAEEEKCCSVDSKPAKKARLTNSCKIKLEKGKIEQEIMPAAHLTIGKEAVSSTEIANSLKGLKTYEEIMQTLQALNISSEKRSEIELALGIMQVTTSSLQAIDDDQAYDILQQASKNQMLSAEKREEARFYLAILGKDRRNEKITTVQAFDIFQQISQNPILSPEIRKEAEFHIAGLRVANRIERITDDEAFKILERLSRCKRLSSSASPTLRIHALYYQACLRLHNRTNRINDKQAYKFFRYVSEDEDGPKYLRGKALISAVRLRLQNRIKIITDEDGISLLTRIVHDESTEKSLRLKACELITTLLKRS